MPDNHSKPVVVFKKDESHTFRSIRNACMTMNFTREIMRQRIEDKAILKGGWRVRYARPDELPDVDTYVRS